MNVNNSQLKVLNKIIGGTYTIASIYESVSKHADMSFQFHATDFLSNEKIHIIIDMTSRGRVTCITGFYRKDTDEEWLGHALAREFSRVTGVYAKTLSVATIYAPKAIDLHVCGESQSYGFKQVDVEYA